MPDTIFERVIRGLGGLLQTTALHVVKPAVITTNDSPIFYPAKFQRSAAMRAMQFDNAESPSPITKEDEVCAQQSHFGWTLLLFDQLAETDGPPVASKHFSAGCSGPNAGEQVVFFSR